jgi:hypothetical protein
MRIDEAERGEKMDANGQGAIVEGSGQAQACVSLGKWFRYRGIDNARLNSIFHDRLNWFVDWAFPPWFDLRSKRFAMAE